jgi:hypothetical protein
MVFDKKASQQHMVWSLPESGITSQDRKTLLETFSQSENEIEAGRQIYYPRPVSKLGDGCHSNLHAEMPSHVQDRVDAWGNLNRLQQWLI